MFDDFHDRMRIQDHQQAPINPSLMYASHKSVKDFPHLHEGSFGEHFQGESIANFEAGGFNPKKSAASQTAFGFLLAQFLGKKHTS